MGLIVLFLIAAAILVVGGTVGLVWQMLHPARVSYARALARGLPTQPAELGLTGREVTFSFSGNVSSPGWIIDGLLPSGPTVVVTHGWSSSRYSSLYKAKLLARFAQRVVVFDLRGHGESSRGLCTLGQLETHDQLAVLDQLEPPAGPVVFYGSSMGAGFCLAAAAAEREQGGPPRVVGLILEGAYRWPMQPVAAHLRARGYPPQPFALLGGWLLALVLTGMRAAEGYRSLQAFDRAKLAARLDCPLLFLHGTADPICAIETAREIAAAAKQARFVEFEGGGHGGLAQLDEERYLDALAEFFAQLPREPAPSVHPQ